MPTTSIMKRAKAFRDEIKNPSGNGLQHRIGAGSKQEEASAHQDHHFNVLISCLNSAVIQKLLLTLALRPVTRCNDLHDWTWA